MLKEVAKEVAGRALKRLLNRRSPTAGWFGLWEETRLAWNFVRLARG